MNRRPSNARSISASQVVIPSVVDGAFITVAVTLGLCLAAVVEGPSVLQIGPYCFPCLSMSFPFALTLSQTHGLLFGVIKVLWLDEIDSRGLSTISTGTPTHALHQRA